MENAHILAQQAIDRRREQIAQLEKEIEQLKQLLWPPVPLPRPTPMGEGEGE